MADSEEIIQGKLAEYVDGTLSDADAQDIERHLESHPSHRTLLEDLRRHRRLLGSLPAADAPSEMMDELRGHLERSALLDGVAADTRSLPVKLSRWPQIYQVAASLALASGLGLAIYFALPGSVNRNVDRVAIRTVPAGPNAPASKVASAEATSPAAGEREASAASSADPAIARAPQDTGGFDAARQAQIPGSTEPNETPADAGRDQASAAGQAGPAIVALPAKTAAAAVAKVGPGALASVDSTPEVMRSKEDSATADTAGAQAGAPAAAETSLEMARAQVASPAGERTAASPVAGGARGATGAAGGGSASDVTTAKKSETITNDQTAVPSDSITDNRDPGQDVVALSAATNDAPTGRAEPADAGGAIAGSAPAAKAADNAAAVAGDVVYVVASNAQLANTQVIDYLRQNAIRYDQPDDESILSQVAATQYPQDAQAPVQTPADVTAVDAEQDVALNESDRVPNASRQLIMARGMTRRQTSELQSQLDQPPMRQRAVLFSQIDPDRPADPSSVAALPGVLKAMGIPVRPDLAFETTLQPGDTLDITIDELVGPGVERSARYRVSDNGSLALPMVEPFTVAGLTLGELQTRIAAEYRGANLIPAATVRIDSASLKHAKPAAEPRADIVILVESLDPNTPADAAPAVAAPVAAPSDAGTPPVDVARPSP